MFQCIAVSSIHPGFEFEPWPYLRDNHKWFPLRLKRITQVMLSNTNAAVLSMSSKLKAFYLQRTQRQNPKPFLVTCPSNIDSLTCGCSPVHLTQWSLKGIWFCKWIGLLWRHRLCSHLSSFHRPVILFLFPSQYVLDSGWRKKSHCMSRFFPLSPRSNMYMNRSCKLTITFWNSRNMRGGKVHVNSTNVLPKILIPLFQWYWCT